MHVTATWLFCLAYLIQQIYSVYCTSTNFTVNVTYTGGYALQVNGVTWLQNAPTFFNENGTKYSNEDGSLKLTTQLTTYHGADRVGDFIGYKFQYTASSGQMMVTIKDYSPQPYVIFEQKYLTKTMKTKNSVCPPPKYPPVPYLGTCFNETISGFPSFLVQQSSKTKLGFLSLGGKMFGDFAKSTGRFSDSDIGVIADGMRSGPLALFDDTGNTLLIAPFTKFMTTSLWYESGPSPRLSWGIMGGINEVPADYTSSTIVITGSGINKAFETYGAILRKFYSTDVQRNSAIGKDRTIHYLGYWTDNGAFYYYNPEKNKTYEQTMLDVKQNSVEQHIPYRYLQLDSWWYYKSKNFEALKEWTARPEVFPNGLRNLTLATNWPIAAHNRYWSNETVYAKQNGGSYTFVKEYILSLPNDQGFWNDLLSNGTEWGLILYEQDWLNIQTLFTGALQTDLNLGETWLTQMGNAAKTNGLSLQYCMALPRHALQSLTIPQVTQVRVSEDYLLDPLQWKIGISSIFAYALNVRPYKDTFWTSKNESVNPRYNGKNEPSPALQSVVSTLSTGPVGPGDKINMVNKTVLMRCCNDDGLILKPSKPATAIDKQIIKAALLLTDGPQGEVWSTFSTIDGLPNATFGIILVADLTGSYNLHPSDTGLSFQHARVVSYQSPLKWSNFDAKNTLQLSGCTIVDFCLYYFSTPILLQSGKIVYILGEQSKWVPVSPQRITKIEVLPDTLHLHINGTSSETITMNFIVDDKLKPVTCTVSNNINLYIDAVKSVCSNTPPTSEAGKTSLYTNSFILLIFSITLLF
ncbi:Hypothetical predicted protein [Mytilus galloprovincialis]|uniref:Uncharacterized protein n=2 Tax=Mytilus galloprovincialis TaxID=29158 RepID=A0A8B6CCS2_MYTGA|nr:Hypothetical predicted protein [Mytilus galloprovincialis]